MICLDKLQYCSNPECRLVLPADPENPRAAGFGVARREDGRVVKFAGRCKDCVRDQRRRHRGTTSVNNRVYTGVRNGVLVLLKVCRKCGKEKVCEDGPGSEFALQSRRPGYAITFNPVCKVCKNQIHKERMATDPEYAKRVRTRQRVYHRKWIADPENLERARRASRKYHRRLKREDPERLREYARIGYVLRQERKGKTVRRQKTVLDGTQPRIVSDPFREWLVAYGAAIKAESGDAIAWDLDLNTRRVNGLLRGEYVRVAQDLVDKALINARVLITLHDQLVVTISDLYTDEELAGG